MPDGGIVQVPRGGGEPTWVVRGRSVTAIAIADGRLYFSSESHLHVRELDGEIHALAVVRNPHAIVRLGDAVAWTEFDNAGSVQCVEGRRPSSVLAEQPYTSDMIAIGNRLYWGQSSRSKRKAAIWRMRPGDEAPEPVAKFAAKTPRLAGNERLLTWIGDNDGGVHAMPT